MIQEVLHILGNGLTIQLVLVAVGYYFLRKIVRKYMIQWLGDEYNNKEIVLQAQLHAKTIWILFGVTVWLLIKNSDFFSSMIDISGSYSVFNSDYLVVNVYSIVSVLVVGYILYTVLTLIRGLLKIAQRNSSDYYETFDSLVHHVGLIIIFVSLLFVAGVSWKVVVPIVSALGIGLGFGLQDIVHNITSGIILLSSQEIKPGDQITVGERMGKVVSIGLRSSVINTLDNVDVIIPNSQLTGNQITNWSYKTPSVRVSIPVGVSYKSDVSLVTETLLSATKNVTEILKTPEPDILFVGFGDSALQFQVRVRVNVKKHPLAIIKSKLCYAIRDALKVNNIEIPFPQQDVWFKNKIPLK